jgi:hypothetical protein
MGDIPSIQHFIIPTLQFKIELPRSELTGYQNTFLSEFIPNLSPPNVAETIPLAKGDGLFARLRP